MRHLLLISIILVAVLFGSIFSTNSWATTTAELKINTIQSIYNNGDRIEISGSGFASNDKIIAALMIIQNDDYTIDLKILQNNQISLDESGNMSGFVILEGIDRTDRWAQILVSTLNSNVVPTKKVEVSGDLEHFSTKKVGRGGTFSFSEESSDDIAQLNEQFDIDIPNTGWTGNVLACVRREYDNTDTEIATVGLSIGNLSISGGQLNGSTNNGSTTYQANTDSIGLGVLDGSFLFGNSTNGYSTVDNVAPKLIFAAATALDNIFLTFNEPVNEGGNAHNNFTINGATVTISDLAPVGSEPTINWNLTLSSGFSDRGVSGVTISYASGSPTDSVADEAGNEVADTTGVVVQDSIPPAATAIRNSNNNTLTIGEFLGSSNYTLRAHVANGSDDTSLDRVEFEGSDNGTSWTNIGTDDTSNVDFEYDWTIGATRFKMFRAHAFDTNGNETISIVVGSATDGTNDNFEDTYQAIITDVVPDTIGASSGSIRSAVVVGYQNNYGDAVNTMGFDITFVVADTTSNSDTWWTVSSGGSGSSAQINLTISSSVTEDTVWYSNDTEGGPNALSLTEAGSNFTNNNGIVDANGQTIVVTVSSTVTVSNPSPSTNSNIDTSATAGSLTLQVELSGGEDSDVSDDFQIIWGVSNSLTPGSYGVSDTSGNLFPPVGGGTVSHSVTPTDLNNLGSAYNYLYWWIENLSLDPQATVLEGAPISSSPYRSIINPHLKTEGGFNGGDVSGGVLAVGQDNQELVSIKFTSNPSIVTILINNLVFDISPSSTVDVNDISTFHLYKDGGTLGTYESGFDVELANVGFGGTNAVFSSFTFTVTGPSDYILVTVDVKPGANPNHTIGLSLANPTKITLQDNVINGPASAITKDSFSNLGISSDVPLPVELSTFSAKAGYGKITLEWETSSELNNEGFYLFRSLEQDRNFEQLNSEIIPGNGNSNTAHSYAFVDEDVNENTTYYYKLSSKDFNGQVLAYGSVVSSTALQLPQTFSIAQNYPNPFNPETHFRFTIAEASRASLKIYNVLGQRIRTIFDNRVFEPGVYEDFSWNATDDFGNPVSNGIYYYEFQVLDRNIRQVNKMLYLK